MLDRYKKCAGCGSQSIAIGEARNAKGHPIYPYYCVDCGLVMTQYASKRAAADFEIGQKHGLRRVYTVTEQRIEAGLEVASYGADQPCVVCGSQGDSEEHHWAPRHLFGDECDKWPRAYLCRSCHVRWHQLVTPNMGARAG